MFPPIRPENANRARCSRGRRKDAHKDGPGTDLGGDAQIAQGIAVFIQQVDGLRQPGDIKADDRIRKGQRARLRQDHIVQGRAVGG